MTEVSNCNESLHNNLFFIASNHPFLLQDCNCSTPASMKKYLFLCISCVLTLGLLYSWVTRPLSPAAFFFDNSGQPNVTILLWHWPFGGTFDLHWDVCWDLCKIPNCRVVAQRSLFLEANVVVFHNRELVTGKEKLPLELRRPPGQRWAWMSLESPVHNGDRSRLAGVFNLTVNYRRDADVTIPYGEFLPRDSEDPVEDIPQNKTDLVCWVVSNYKDSDRRSKVYKELSAVIPVKVYGDWSNNPLASEDLLPTISRCYFYLAFENSIAKDYITEKLWWNSYKSGAVPIVLGPPVADYEAVTPPHSFIHVDEFASVKELAEYLQQLAGDVELYGEYLQWRKDWKVQMYEWRWRLCQICVQYPSFPEHKVYTDLAAWDDAA
ncbi:alpha-(1,3)-fucosyltransferase 7-like [Entelurus aequoreus]|uniref:alpha-(1,3)-fucosyltransferase 7-like n=1 Tax=Entelurus aequoreus TaxID=161455 RepID=UPI002B1E131F|nr:alpha-(1,3)-fucosyltransferase 7-like [Entelurus aequoreus]